MHKRGGATVGPLLLVETNVSGSLLDIPVNCRQPISKHERATWTVIRQQYGLQGSKIIRRQYLSQSLYRVPSVKIEGSI